MFGFEHIVWDEDDNGLVIAAKAVILVALGLLGYALLMLALAVAL